MKYFISLILILIGVALLLHFENDQLLSVENESNTPVTPIVKRSTLGPEIIQNTKVSNANQLAAEDSAKNEPSDDDLPDSQELTDLAEENQRGLDEIESQTEYDEKIRQKIYESGSDFISLNMKKNKVTE